MTKSQGVEKSEMTISVQKKIGKLVRLCESAQESTKEFVDELMLVNLIGNIKQIEEERLRKQLQHMEETRPTFLRELLHEKHMARVMKNNIKREVREDHKFGISDPSRLAAKYEKRMYFGEHIKKNDMGKKKHVVQT